LIRDLDQPTNAATYAGLGGTVALCQIQGRQGGSVLEHGDTSLSLPELPAFGCKLGSRTMGWLCTRNSDSHVVVMQSTSCDMVLPVRRSPRGIFRAHPPDQRAQFRIDLRSASKRAGFPTPVPTEAGSIESLGPDDPDGLEDRWKPAIHHDQEQAIPIRELDATARPPLQHDHLMSECRVLCLTSAL